MENKVTSVISKKQVLEILKEFRSCSYLTFSELDFIDAVKTAVEDLPEGFCSEGHWSNYRGGFECSLCGYAVIADDVDDMYFCPNCGANLIEYKENNGIE